MLEVAVTGVKVRNGVCDQCQPWWRRRSNSNGAEVFQKVLMSLEATNRTLEGSLSAGNAQQPGRQPPSMASMEGGNKHSAHNNFKETRGGAKEGTEFSLPTLRRTEISVIEGIGFRRAFH